MSIKLGKKLPGHRGHLWMMAICCGLAIAGFLVFPVLGISLLSLETLLFLICPIGMIGMMYFMHRDSCAGGRQDENDLTARSDDEAGDGLPPRSQDPESEYSTRSKGWFEA